MLPKSVIACLAAPTTPVLPTPGVTWSAGFPEPIGGNVRRSRLVHRQLGMGVNVFIKGFKIG